MKTLVSGKGNWMGDIMKFSPNTDKITIQQFKKGVENTDQWVYESRDNVKQSTNTETKLKVYLDL